MKDRNKLYLHSGVSVVSQDWHCRMLLSVVVCVVEVEVSAVVQEVEVFDSIDSTTHTHTISINLE
jgi:hypothetical protein